MSTATSLKRLRERSGLSVRKLAALIDVDASRYAYFEDANRFKKPYLEMDMAKRLARVLGDHGIEQAEVMRLAGVDHYEPFGLTRGEEAWIVVWRALSTGQRRMMLQLSTEMLGWEQAVGEPDLSVVFAHA